jgi:two-component system response regulator FixJ
VRRLRLTYRRDTVEGRTRASPDANHLAKKSICIICLVAYRGAVRILRFAGYRVGHSIYVVDDDKDARVSTVFLLRALGFEPRPFLNTSDLMASRAELQPGIVLFHLSEKTSSAHAVLAAVPKWQLRWPVVILADVIGASEAVALMKLGASDVIEKPVEAQALAEAIESAGRDLAERLIASDRVRRSQARINALTPRELEVLRALLAGYTNKRVAELCSISVRTVEMHRANLLERLGVETLVGAVRIALEAGVKPLDQDAA